MSTQPASSLSKEWRRAPLDEVCDVIQGQSPPGTTYNSDGLGLPFFQGKAEFGDYYPTPRKWCTAPKKIAEAGDVLISIRAPVGPTNLCPARSCIGRGLAALRPKEGVPPKYILYAIRASVDELLGKATGSTFEAVNGKDLRTHEISLAPVDERPRIVAEIEKHFTRLEAGVAGLRRVQASLKRYRAAVLKAACEGKLVPTEAELARQEERSYETGAQLLDRILTERRKNWKGKGKYKEPVAPEAENLPRLPEGWKWASLDQLQLLLRNGISKKPDAEFGLPILRISAVRPLSVNLADTRYLKAQSGAFSEFLLSEGDLLFTRYNGNPDLVGVCGVIHGLSSNLVHPDKLIRCKLVVDKPLSKFVGVMANIGASRGFLAKRVRTTAGQSGISGGDLRQLPIPLAPVAEQQRIVAEVERRLSVVEELEAVVNANLQRVTRLRQSILQRAFEGKLLHNPREVAEASRVV